MCFCDRLIKISLTARVILRGLQKCNQHFNIRSAEQTKLELVG